MRNPVSFILGGFREVAAALTRGGGRVAGGEARVRAQHAQATLKFEPSGRTRLINVNVRSNTLGSCLFVNMSPLWEDVFW